MLHAIDLAPSVGGRAAGIVAPQAWAGSSCLFLDAEPATQHRIVQALFERVEVLGPNEVRLYPGAEVEPSGLDPLGWVNSAGASEWSGQEG